MNQATYLSGHKSHLNPDKLLVFNPVCSFTFSLFMVRSAGAAPDTPSPTAGLSSHPYISSRTPLWSSEALRLRFLCWKNKKWLYMEGPSISFKGKSSPKWFWRSNKLYNNLYVWIRRVLQGYLGIKIKSRPFKALWFWDMLTFTCHGRWHDDFLQTHEGIWVGIYGCSPPKSGIFTGFCRNCTFIGI